MKAGIYNILILLTVFLFLSGCSPAGMENQPEDKVISVGLSLNTDLLTKASVDIGKDTSVVDRILVVPFQKVNVSLPDSRTDNFIPVWNFARQWNVSSFPVQSLKLGLMRGQIYKVLVLGYNHLDYDFYNPSLSTNWVVLNSQPLPTTLANFQLYPKSANQVPEFFTCFCISAGNAVFEPQEGGILSGRLGRVVSGLSVQVTGIPGYVKSVSLVADKMVKAVRVADTTASLVQMPGDNENRVIQTQNVVSGNVKFSNFLLPTGVANKTLLYLDITLGATRQRYTIKLPETDVSVDNQVILMPNSPVKITGDYDKINYGFTISRDINLDDDVWDGLN